jgi:hypothetical protein
LCNEKHILIKIEHKLYLTFKFDLTIPLTENTIMSGQDLYIKNLENEVKSLKLFVKNYMEVTVMHNKKKYYPNIGYTSYKLTLPINSTEIDIRYCNTTNSEKIIYLRFSNDEKFNENFKIINCKILNIYNVSYDFGYDNLPESIEEISIENMNNESINIFLNGILRRELPNLHTLEFKNCNNCERLTKVYESFVFPLSLKTIKITKCNNFAELELLKTYKIECVVY